MTIHFACSTICFRSSPIEEALREIKKAGFQAIDLAIIPGFCPHYNAANTPESEWDPFVDLVHGSGLTVASVTAVPGQFNAPDADFDQIVEAGRANARMTKKLGVSILNVNFGMPLVGDRSSFREDAIHNAKGIQLIADYAADLGITVCIEAPHRNGLCRTLEEAEFAYEQIDESNVKFLVDSTHILAGGTNPEEAVRQLGERIGHVHLRDGKGEDVLYVPGDGGINFKAFFEALDEVGFSGTSALELEGVGDTIPERQESVSRAMQHLLPLADSYDGYFQPS